MKYVVIIPARGGSKGIPRKNIKEIHGKPLIAWSIQTALSCDLISDVFVSTDSEEIKDISIKYGAKVPYMRPKELSGDKATTESAILHFLSWADLHEIEIENIILMQATSPFRYAEQLKSAILKFEEDGADSLLTVVESHRFIWQEEDGVPVASYDYTRRPRRQDIDDSHKVYLENGSFYITKKAMFTSHGNRLCGRISMYKMTQEESFEIDDPIDFKLVGFLMKEYGAFNDYK